MYYNPQLTDRILMNLGQRNGPAINTSPQRIIADETARDFAVQKQAESDQERLNLAKLSDALNRGIAEKRLSQGSEQFNKGLEFSKYKFDTGLQNARDELSKNRELSNLASLISLGGLGVEGLRSYQGIKRNEQLQNKYDDMIKFYQDQGDTQSKRFAELINLLRIQ